MSFCGVLLLGRQPLCIKCLSQANFKINTSHFHIKLQFFSFSVLFYKNVQWFVFYICIWKWLLLIRNKRKRKNTLKFLVKMICIDFWSWPVIGVLYKEADVLVRELRRGNINYTIYVKERKTAMWIIPLGSNSAISFTSSSISSLFYLVEDESDW